MKAQNPSLKLYLYKSLLASALVAGLLTIGSSYYFNLKDLRPYLDSHLILQNQLTSTLVKNNAKSKKPEPIQQVISPHLNQVDYDYQDKSVIVEEVLKSTLSEVRNENFQLLGKTYQSKGKQTLEVPEGFSYVNIDGKLYRRYTSKLESPHLYISTLQKHETRQTLEKSIVIKFLYIFLSIYMILAITVTIILRKGMNLIVTASELLRKKKKNPQFDISKSQLPIELKPFFQSLNGLISRLNAAWQRERRFASDAAHELKTPLAALSAHLQVAMITKDQQKQNASLEKCLTSVKRSCHTVEQLLTLSRTVPELNGRQVENLHIKPILDQICKDSYELPIINKCPEKTFALINERSINIVLKIIIENALKFGATELLIDTYESNKYVTLSLCDNGPGVEQEHLHRLGERFFRVYGTQTDGSGIGLNIAMEIMSYHSGAIYFSQNDPKGLSVHLCLPKTSAH